MYSYYKLTIYLNRYVSSILKRYNYWRITIQSLQIIWVYDFLKFNLSSYRFPWDFIESLKRIVYKPLCVGNISLEILFLHISKFTAHSYFSNNFKEILQWRKNRILLSKSWIKPSSNLICAWSHTACIARS